MRTGKKKAALRLTASWRIFLAAALLFQGCDAMYDVIADRDPQTDFSKYATFAWLHDEQDSLCNHTYDRIARDNIRNYVGLELAKRGFSVKPDTPDVLLRLTVRHNRVPRTVVTHVHYPAYYHHRYYAGSRYYFPYPAVYYYDFVFIPPPAVLVHTAPAWEGVVWLQMFDRASGKQVWSASARVDVHDRRYLHRHIHPAIEAMMRRFPVGERIKPADEVYVTN